MGTEKVSKESVHYRHAKGQRMCDNCSMYRPTSNGHGLCTHVLGGIKQTDVCDDWYFMGAKNG